MSGIGPVKPVDGGEIKLFAKDGSGELKKAVADFEALFINQMLKTMRETVSKDGLFHGGSGEEIYTALLDAELSKGMAASGGIGLGDMLLKDLSARGGDVPLKTELPPYGQPLKAGTPAIREPQAAPARSGQFAFPLKEAKRVSSGFGERMDPITGEARFHHGIDIAANHGAPVYPAAPGRVVFSGDSGGYGKMVEILHDDGLVTRYGHNSKNLVNKGDRVDTSEPIAYVGSTGRSTGPHLHFEVLRHGTVINPDTLYG